MEKRNRQRLMVRMGHGGGIYRYILWYTLLFAAVSALVFLPFVRAGKSFAWITDGLSQVMAGLSFVSKYIRTGVKDLLAGRGWTFPLYDFHNGITALNTQYGPLQALGVLFHYSETYRFYLIFTLVNFYLTGLSFVYFGWWFRQKTIPVLVGAVSYTFCGFALFAGVRHPHFMMPMMLLPLLVVGVEKVMRRERSWLLTVTVFLSEISLFGVYFSCMQAVFLGLYVCVRFFDLYREHRVREFVHVWLRLALWGMPGALLGCFTALPTLLSILGGNRVGINIWTYADPLRYDNKYYQDFLSSFVVHLEISSYWMRLGLSVLCLPAVVLLFIRKVKGGRTLRILFLILTAMHLIPAVAYVMSGFSNISNRFCFGYAFCVSAILMFMLPRLAEVSWRQGQILGGAAVLYTGCCVDAYLRDEWLGLPANAMALLLSLAAVFVIRLVWKKKAKALIPALCLAITCGSVIYTAFTLYDESRGNYVSEFYEDTYKQLKSGQYSSLGKSKPVKADDSFFRVVGDKGYRFEQNYAFYYDLNGLTAYPFYGQSTAYTSWLREMEAPWTGVAHRFNAFVRQSELMTLANVKYYACRNSDQWDWPYGFHEVDRIANGKNTDVILENENWLPLGYTYNKYMTREDYEKLNALEKRQAQMQAVVLDDAPAGIERMQAEDIVPSAQQIPVQALTSDGVVWHDGSLTVEKEKATMTVSFQGLPETESYLRIVDLDLTDGANETAWILTATTEETTVRGQWQADAYVYAHHQHTQTMDLGYSHEGIGWVTLTFPQKGIYKLEDIQIWCQSMDGFAAQAAALRAEPLEDIKTNWRGLTGRVELSEDKILCLALPWLDGWTAKVDGQPAALLHVNTAFMGLELPAGEHEIQLQYWMPGLTKGLVLTALGALGCAGLALACRRKEKLHK